MNNLDDLKRERDEAYKKYQEAQSELDNFEFNQKRKQYGNDFRCSRCRYSCLTEVSGWDNLCMQGRWADGACKHYEPDNRLSLYIKQYKYPSYETWSNIAELLDGRDVAHLLDNEEMFDKAIAIDKVIQEK